MKQNTTQKQRDRLIDYLKAHKSIDRIQAQTIGIGELPSRICELKKLGFVFEKGWNDYSSSYGEYSVRKYTVCEVTECA